MTTPLVPPTIPPMRCVVLPTEDAARALCEALREVDYSGLIVPLQDGQWAVPCTTEKALEVGLSADDVQDLPAMRRWSMSPEKDLPHDP